jgi:hypothetical protein
MTTIEFCQSVGLTARELEDFLDIGLLEAEPAATRQGKRILEFAANLIPRARLIKQLVRNLAFDQSQLFVVYDGQQLRPCRDADAAIAAVVRAKRWASAVDLTAIRAGAAE